MKKTYVSIDWGGTHLSGAIIRPEADDVFFDLPSCNLKLVSDENLIIICKNIITEILKKINSKFILLIGAAGVSNDATADRLIKIFNSLTDLIQNINVYPDFLCNHASFLNGEDGILSINGTGSILFGVKGKKQIRLGGWGYLFDDTPSGGYFGKKYLEAVLNGMEGSEAYQNYYESFKSNYNITKREELLNEIYFAPSIQNYLGNYAKDLTIAYESNEPYAKKTIDESIEKLSESIYQIINCLDLKNPRFCGSGGLWSHWKPLKNLLNVSCEKLGVQLVWQNSEKPLCFGPYLLYKREI